MKNDLYINELHGPRFELAIELAQHGSALNFNRVSITLGDNIVECAVNSRFTPSNLSEAQALKDIEHGKSVYTELVSKSQTFAHLVEGKQTKYSIIYDYHTGCVLLCQLVDGEIKWAEGL